ncbi:type II secretion system F family protein [Syntrophorhabdus aromaticivorans]|uniref:Pilus assembly protein n=1 Tax=Syntrophorhabdus aromaticivorans TaxID=328301 RepID=A0A971S1H5_9BACT|nr:type II secretion system F family protein [Syntrophorhabdus aromaticivorans]NLW36485.1 pilus assembly protein [Syntrophorhabdus aromaticivorans]
MGLLLMISIFVAAAFIIVGLLLLCRPRWALGGKVVEKRLIAYTAPLYDRQAVDIMKKGRKLSDIPWLHRVLTAIPGIYQLDRLVAQSNAPFPVGVFVLLSLTLLAFAYLAFFLVTRSSIPSIIMGLVAGSIPVFFLKVKKEGRMRKFERQLPEALDLVARSLKAGHAFSGGLQAVGQEFGDPIGPEFTKALNEINFGTSIDQALKNLSLRVDVADLKLFAVSAIIQRESGGNLAEILGSISGMMRERFKLVGRIRTLSAEGRISAIILVALPIFVALVLFFVNPQYLRVLTDDPMGKVLVIIAIIMMAFGIMMMKKLINIRV